MTTERSESERERSGDDAERHGAERRQRAEQQRGQERQEALGVTLSPPPYESPETPLERLGPGFAYMLLFVGGALVVNLAVLAVIALLAGG